MATEDEGKKKPGLVGKAGRGMAKMVFSLVFGVVLLFGAFFVLVWGEARVNIAAAIEQSPQMSDASDGMGATLTDGLHFSRPADEPLLEGNHAYVVRSVETCAWIEEEAKDKKGGTSIKYIKRWTTEVPDSDDFESRGYDNKEPTLKPKTSIAVGLGVGKYELAEVTEWYAADTLAPQASQVSKASRVEKEWAYILPETDCSENGTAAIGAQRLSFKVLREGSLVTVFGKKMGTRIEPFRGQVLLANGDRKVLVASLAASRESTTWYFRLGGALLLWIALYLILSPALKLVTWVPILGGMIQGAATVVTLVVALVATLGFVFLEWGMAFFTNLFGGLVG